MNKIKIFGAFTLMAVLGAAGGSGGAWWFIKHAGAHEPARQAPVAYKYTSLDKVIVMLRAKGGGNTPHYLAIDLVFKTAPGHDAATREQLPLLRSLAVRTLSDLSYETATSMTVDQFAQSLNTAYAENYSKDGREQPFAEAMVAKLLIE
jgi:flagellar FliL protein